MAREYPEDLIIELLIKPKKIPEKLHYSKSRKELLKIGQ